MPKKAEDTDKKGCKKKFCQDFYINKSYKKIKESEKILKTVKGKQMVQSLLQNKDVTQKDVGNMIKNAMKTMKNDAELKKKVKENCEIMFCNPGCKQTMFQDGKEFPKDLESKHKNPAFKNLLKTTRKMLFQGKNTVLKDGFYDKMNFKGDVKSIDELKKKGAISGCSSTVDA